MTSPQQPMEAARSRNVTAILGPTNTGKTHLAIERMLAHSSGVIGLPLRLLAREVYQRVADRVGAGAVALITGEEKIVPPSPRYRVCTVEALPSETDASFLAIDEIQLAADLERGHIFTDRILNLRGRDETLLLGAATMRRVIETLVPGVNVVTRPRLSVLSYSGPKKITRLPRRSAVVAFSADEVYAIGELIRRQRGGVAVVLGALSPRTRNAQVELFQNGDVDFLVATDAIGMGLNLDLDHVAFASDRKFDGYQHRRLTPAEFAQVAGRAGRHMKDGTFGVTGRADPFEDELVEALESHRFESVKLVQWRNRDLDFASLASLQASLDWAPTQPGLAKALPAEDVNVLAIAARDPEIAALADRRDRVSLLWDICQLPDYRRIAFANHADLVLTVFRQIARTGVISKDWFADHVAYADRTDGDIDTLANRIAHIRTWTYAANRPNWLADQSHWQERTRAIEDRLSDALHERLTQRFVDRRTSVLMRRLRENTMPDAEITADGDVVVEGLHVGQLQGFRFVPDPAAGGPDAKAIRAAAQQALSNEISRRAEGVAGSGNDQFVLASDGVVRWHGLTIARLAASDDILRPKLLLLADEALTGPAQEAVVARLDQWLAQHVETLLKPLFDLRQAEALAPAARGLAFRLTEALGVLDRSEVAEEVRALEQEMRAGLRQLGVRFGAHHIYVPVLLKPHPSGLLAILWGLKHGGLDAAGVAELPLLSAAGRTTIPVDPAFSKALYRVVGYRVSGQRAVRIDILERLADVIRPLLGWRPTPENATPPDGVAARGGFMVTPTMNSLLGCSGEDFASVLRSLGYRVERRAVAPPLTVAPAVPAGADGATPSAAPADRPEPTGWAEEPLAPPAAPVVSAPAPAPDAAASTEAATEAPAEPAFIEVWRPGRPPGERTGGRPKGNGEARVARAERSPRERRAPDAGPTSERPAQDRPERQRRPRRGEDRSARPAPAEPPAPKPRDRPMDPNSPFAALAALKADLERRQRG